MMKADKIDAEKAQGAFPFMLTRRVPAPKKTNPKKEKFTREETRRICNLPDSPADGEHDDGNAT